MVTPVSIALYQEKSVPHTVVHPLDGDANDGAGGGVLSRYQVSVIYLDSLPVWRYTCTIFCPSAQLAKTYMVCPSVLRPVHGAVVVISQVIL